MFPLVPLGERTWMSVDLDLRQFRIVRSLGSHPSYERFSKLRSALYLEIAFMMDIENVSVTVKVRI